MSVFSKTTLSLAASAVFAAFSLSSAHAQQARVVSEKPLYDDLQSPEGGDQKSGFKPKNWLEIEAKLRVSLADPPKSKTCEKLTIKWYVAVKNPEKSGILLLEKTVDHVNIPLDEDIYCSVYLSPASLRRLGFDSGGKRAVEAVGYEVLIDGTKVAVHTTKGSPDKPWWSAGLSSISRSDSIPLLNKTETPFSSMWWDRYAEVSERRD